jgi:hypothetical protein
MKAIVFAVSLATLTACVDSEPEIDGTDRVAINSLLPGDIQASSLGTAALTNTAIHDMGQTATGRSYLSYMIDCALNSSQSLTVQVGLNQYTFTGSMAIQPRWTTAALSTTDQQLVTSCVLARANYYGDAVNISLRGPSSVGYQTTSTELANYKIEEGAFYGNILGGGTAVMHACIGVDQAHDDTQGDLPIRKCASGTSWCNFTNDGDCASVCTWSSNGYYTNCNSMGLASATIYLYGTPD